MAKKLGLLAYGSLVGEPGPELEEVTKEIIEHIVTPFPVEFARLSTSRSKAPTLVPVKEGGAQVPAVIFVMDTTLEDAEHRLWRRETRKTGNYMRPDEPNDNTVTVERLRNFAGVETVLYTRIGANIWPADRTAVFLAKAAIDSAKKRKDGKDGITYLRDALANGLVTPLSAPYEAEILKRVGVDTLDEAIDKFKTPPPKLK